VTAAITKVNNVSSALGSATNVLTGIQSSVTNLSTSLTTGVGALTDADLAAESAQLTSLQTKQQLAIQALSIANSGPQSLLSLFK
jgi:flagellin